MLHSTLPVYVHTKSPSELVCRPLISSVVLGQCQCWFHMCCMGTFRVHDRAGNEGIYASAHRRDGHDRLEVVQGRGHLRDLRRVRLWQAGRQHRRELDYRNHHRQQKSSPEPRGTFLPAHPIEISNTTWQTISTQMPIFGWCATILSLQSLEYVFVFRLNLWFFLLVKLELTICRYDSLKTYLIALYGWLDHFWYPTQDGIWFCRIQGSIWLDLLQLSYTWWPHNNLEYYFTTRWYETQHNGMFIYYAWCILLVRAIFHKIQIDFALHHCVKKLLSLPNAVQNLVFTSSPQLHDGLPMLWAPWEEIIDERYGMNPQ